MKYKTNRGSEWYKWDLHVHTPFSIESEYGGEDDEVWEKFISALEDLPKEIKVLGINDYLFLDGYEKVLEYKHAGRLSNIELILPVIELRLKEFVGQNVLGRINFHIIFADESQLSVETIKFHFLTGLTAKANFSVEYNKPGWGGVINRETLIDLGEYIYNSIPEDKKPPKKFLKIGFENINFELSKIKALLGEEAEPKTYLEKKYFKVIGRAEWEDFRWDGSVLEKKNLINEAHFIFSASPTVESANKGIEMLKKQSVNHRLLHCSDSHKFAESSDITKPKEIGHCYTWIKSCLSFEGLRQVVYESELRCKIQKDNPCNKRMSSVIKSVRFLGHPDFQKEKIFLNKDMNTIIGGKSSGKSLLLYYIAYTINNKYAHQQFNYGDDEQKNNQNNEIKDDYEFSSSNDFDFIVEWEDGAEYKLSDKKNEKQRPIVYIPQSYILNFTKGIEKRSRHMLGEFIRDILKQEVQCKEEYQLFVGKVKALDLVREKAIDQYFVLQDDISRLKQEKNNIGDIFGIKKQISLLKEKIVTLKGNSITDEQLKRYTLLNKRNSVLEQTLGEISTDFDSFSRIIDNIKASLKDIKVVTDVSKNGMKTKYFNPILQNLEVLLNTVLDDIDQKNQEGTAIYGRCKEKVEKIERNITSTLKPFQELLHHKDEIISLEKEIKEEERKILKIKDLENQITTTLKLQDEQRKTFFKCYEDAYKEYELIIDKLNARAIGIPNLEIKGSIKYYYNRLRTKFFDHYYKRTPELKNNFLLEEKDNSILPDVNFEKHFEEIKNIFKLIITDKLTLLKNKEHKDGIKALFKDNFFDYWELFIGKDEMATMSPGQANLAILKLLIELSDAECPILIDQPEDNLDNRSIYGDLVQFIRKRKENRQLIIVTHNPNIVVGADSENIIVANQTGQDLKRDNKKYRFEYVNGALEHTFPSKEDTTPILYRKGIREHVAEILEGGKEAFKKREEKYGF